MKPAQWKTPAEEPPPLRKWVFVVQADVGSLDATTPDGLDGIEPPNNCGLAYWDGEEWFTEYHEEAVEPLLWTEFPKP